MKKIEIVKTVGGIIVSVGVGAIVGNVIKDTTPEDVGKIKKMCIGLGSVVLTNMVGDKAVTYIEDKVDNAVKAIKKVTVKDSD
jgi:uncharacterized membrane protein